MSDKKIPIENAVIREFYLKEGYTERQFALTLKREDGNNMDTSQFNRYMNGAKMSRKTLVSIVNLYPEIGKKLKEKGIDIKASEVKRKAHNMEEPVYYIKSAVVEYLVEHPSDKIILKPSHDGMSEVEITYSKIRILQS